jgi:hypothetical protein
VGVRGGPVIVSHAQRWRARRDTYRPAGEVIRTADFEVAKIPDDRTAKAFVVAHHYSASYPAARVRVGLYRRAEIVGVAVFSVPAQPAVLAPFGDAPAVELGRFVLVDSVPGNGESWFLARAFESLRADGFAGVVSFSDPVARARADGSVVHGGHIGTIYQASNAIYTGRSKAETRRLLPDGTLLHGRALAKIRRRDRGWRYASGLLERHGAEPLGEHEDAAAWVARWVPALTRPLRHGGNHRYLFALERGGAGRALRRALGPGLAYPKVWTQTKAAA